MDVMKDANSSSQRDKVLGVPTVAWKFVRLIAHTGMYVISRKEVVDVLNNAADMAGRPFAYHALQQVDEAGDKFAALLGHGFRIIAALVTNGVSLSQQAGHGMVGRLLTGGEDVAGRLLENHLSGAVLMLAQDVLASVVTAFKNIIHAAEALYEVGTALYALVAHGVAVSYPYLLPWFARLSQIYAWTFIAVVSGYMVYGVGLLLWRIWKRCM